MRPGSIAKRLWPALFLLLAACGDRLGDLPEAPTSQNIASYHLGPGDHLKVTVYDEPNLTGEFQLSDRGTLSMPLVGEVDANGLTASQLKTKLERQIVDKRLLQDPNIGLEVITYRPYYILGEVKNPGAYQYSIGMNVMRAVAEGGGFTYRAKQDSIKITRGDQTLESYRASPTTPVMPGDTIEVLERVF